MAVTGTTGTGIEEMESNMPTEVPDTREWHSNLLLQDIYIFSAIIFLHTEVELLEEGAVLSRCLFGGPRRAGRANEITCEGNGAGIGV